MATLILVQGQSFGRQFRCDGDTTVIGRQADCGVCLDDPAVSRRHAQIIRAGRQFVVEDLGSSNGTFLNGHRVVGREIITENDALQVGPYVLALRPDSMATTLQIDPVVRSQVPARTSNASLFSQNAAYKLKVIVEIAQHLGRTLEVGPLLDKLLEMLFRLLPQADRGLVILTEGDRFVVRAQRQRHSRPSQLDMRPGHSLDFPFSRTLVRKALDEGVGLLSENVGDDPSIAKTATLMGLNVRSLLCVPLIGLDQRRLGVLQLESMLSGAIFKHDDLELLTAVSLQVAGVLENAALHEERLREERLRQELAVAREIQQSFLPQDFDPLKAGGYELFARFSPAREVGGDLYDFFARPDGKLALFLGDVSGKGMPAALFMVAVRTLIRHLAGTFRPPGETLAGLNDALVSDNPTNLFVTMAHATFDPTAGEVVIAAGGHPPPILRKKDGEAESVNLRAAMMLGYSNFEATPAETAVTLEPGQLLAFYSDGMTEVFKPDRQEMFGVNRLQELIAGPAGGLPLSECAEAVFRAVAVFAENSGQQDDQTLLLLRRK
jgi:serine phosphatase RsbU (regulator of sigma subunit)